MGESATIRIMLKVTTVFFVLTLSVLAVLHYVALEFSLYWRFAWFDIFMHFFGGAVVALGFFTLKDFIHSIPDRLQYFVPIISGVIVAALSWELFEIMIGIPAWVPGYGFDTVIDLIMGTLGGFAGFIVGHSIRKL